MGPDLRISTRSMGMPPMGVPQFNTGAPVSMPNTPNVHTGAPIMTQGQAAAQAINYAQLRGHARGGIGNIPDGPNLRDVAPSTIWQKIPKWALWVGGLSGFALTAFVIFRLLRR